MIALVGAACGDAPPPSVGSPDAGTMTSTEADPHPAWLPQTLQERYCPHGPRAYLEVEQFEGPWRAQSNLRGFSGEGFSVSNESGIATTTMCGAVTLTSTGTFAVWARGYRSAADRQFSVSVDGERLATTHGLTYDSDEEGFFWEPSGQAILSSPTVEVCVHDEGASFEVADAVLLTRDLGCNPADYDRRVTVLDRSFARDMLRQDVLRRAAAYRDAIPVPDSIEAWNERRDAVRERVRQSMGFDQWPAKTPLNVVHHGTQFFEGYSVERISFESRPGFIVPANVYVPDGEGPFPAMVHAVGHFGGSKADIVVTQHLVTMARFGFVGITYDPFGQGERNSAANRHDVHFKLLLSGLNNTTVMVWDTVRAVDVLLERDDVDPNRLGVTGASGGGLNSLYAMAFDERFWFGAPIVYVSPIYDFMLSGAGHDPCSRNPIGAFTDRGEIMALSAPRPQVQLIGDFDSQFPLGEASGEQAFAIYELFDADDMFQYGVFDVPHEVPADMRALLYQEAARHLGNGGPVPVDDITLPPPPASALRVFPGGLPTSVTVIDYAREAAEQNKTNLPGPGAFDPAVLRSTLRRALRAPEPHAPTAWGLGTFETRGLELQRLAVSVNPDVELPVLLHDHEDPEAPLVLAVDRRGLLDLQVLRLAERGVAAAAVSVRGTGESGTTRDTYYVENNLILQDPLLVLRAFDVSQAAQALRQLYPQRRLVLLARGLEDALVGLVAQALWMDFDAAVIDGVMGSWLDAFDREFPYEAYVHRILKLADVPHLVELARDRPLLVVPRDGSSLEVHGRQWVAHQQDVWAESPPAERDLFEWITAQ